MSFPGESAGVRRWRRRFKIPMLCALLLGVVDLWLLVLIGHRIGALPVVLFVIAEAALGSWVIRRRWRSVWRSLADVNQERLAAQQAGEPLTHIVDTGLVVAGGLALIFPGVITALLGLVCLVPFIRSFPAAFLRQAIARSAPDLGGLGGFGARSRGETGFGDVIEGEVVEDPSHRGGDDGADDSDEPVVVRGEVTERPDR